MGVSTSVLLSNPLIKTVLYFHVRDSFFSATRICALPVLRTRTAAHTHTHAHTTHPKNKTKHR